MFSHIQFQVASSSRNTRQIMQYIRSSRNRFKLWLLIRWLLQWSFITSNPFYIILAKLNHKHSLKHSIKNVMSSLPSLSKSRKKCFHHLPLLLVKNNLQLSNLWFLVKGTQWCALTSCLKYVWSAAAKTFSGPKSVISLIGHPWDSFIQSK